MSRFAHEIFHGHCLIRLSATFSGSVRNCFRSLIMHYAMLLSTQHKQARPLPAHLAFACHDESVWSWLYRHLRIALHQRKQA
jgi:hypothetical protein